MANEKVLGFRIEVKGTDKETTQLVKLGAETDNLKQRIRELNKIRKDEGRLTKAQSKERERLKTQLKANNTQYNALNKQILVNNGVTKKSTGFIKNMGKSIAGSIVQMGAMFLGFRAIAGAVAGAVKIFVGFQKENSKLQAISRATTNEMSRMKDQAKELGSTTAFTAREVTGLQIEFAKLGFPTDDIIQMTEATLNGAAALGSDLGEQAALTGAVLKQYGLDATKAGKVNDVLAESASSSALDFQKLSTALPIVGATAATAGVSLERTTALLGTLSDRGLDASSSGTALRNVFLELSKQGLTFEEAMAKINNATDKNAVALKLFGKRGATAGVILAETGESAQQLEERLLGAEGAAKKMADTMLDNLSGDITIAKSAWEGFVLSLEDGEGKFSKIMRGMTQSFTKFLSNISDEDIGDSLGLNRGLFQDFDKTQMVLIEMARNVDDMTASILKGKTGLSDVIKATSQLRREQGKLDTSTEEGAARFEILERVIRKVEAGGLDLIKANNKIDLSNKKVVDSTESKIKSSKKELDAAKKKAEEAKKLEETLQKELREIKIKNENEGREEDKLLLALSFDEKIKAIKGSTESEIELRKQLEIQKRQALAAQQVTFDEEDKEKEEETKEKQKEKDAEELNNLIARQELKHKIISDSLGIVAMLNDAAGNNELNKFDKRAKAQLASFQGTEEQKLALQEKLNKQRDSIEKKAFERRKKLQLAEVGISLGKEIASINANAAGNPANAITFGAAGISQAAILTAIAVGKSLANAALISSQKFHDGGLVQGPSHDQGGIQMYHKSGAHMGEMEGNEYIISAKRAEEIGKENLDAINFNGVSPAANGFFANGGQVPVFNGSSSSAIGNNNSFNTEELANLISIQMQEAIIRTPVVNNAVDTFNTAANVVNTESELSFG